MSGTGTFVVDPVGPACWAVGLVSGMSHRCSIGLGYGEFRRPGGHLGLFVVFLCSFCGVSGCIVQRCLGASTQRILSRSGFNVVADWLYMNDEQEAAGQAGSLSGGAQRRQLEDS